MIAPSPDDPLGYDVFVRDDIDADGRDATGLELVENGILHRITTEKLLLTDAPSGEEFVDFGEDVRTWVGAVDTTDSANARIQRLVEVIRRDPNIDPSSVRIDIQMGLSGTKWAFRLAIAARTTTELPIALTVGVDAVSVQLLSLGR